MIRIFILMLVAFSFSMRATSEKYHCNLDNSMLNIGRKLSMHSVKAIGKSLVQADEIIIQESIKIADASKLTAQTLVVGNNAYLKNSQVSNMVAVNGSVFEAELCSFGAVETCATTISFSRTTAHRLEVKRNSSTNQQIVRLDKQTIITGDIVFEQGDGIVIMEKGAEVRGKIIGGKKQLI